MMNMKVALSCAVLATALESAAALFFIPAATTTTAAGVTTTTSNALVIGGASAGTTAAVLGGALLIKGLALGAVALAAASRNRRAALEIDSGDAAFLTLAQAEPAQCYRRFICDLATGEMPKSDNDIITKLFDKDTPIESPKFEFATAAKLGKTVQKVQACELRYSCPLTGAQIQGLF